MCGILSIIGKKEIDTAHLEQALVTLSKRGPDERGTMSFSHCILGQTRLSIIDLAGGHQPMRDNAQNIAITFNGEIYNYQELKKHLESKGHIFSTQSDTEVILKAYIEYGSACPEKLDGMFAFVIWDEEKQQLFMARDRFGEKPLYYTFDHHGNFVCASEIKALFAMGTIKGEADPEAISNYLSLLYIPPWKTVYKNIFVLRPAHSAIVKNGAVTTTQYWKLKRNPLNVTLDEAKDTVSKLLHASVKSRMIADVEVGTFLSGGIDSSIITHLSQDVSTHPVKSFSAGFENFINELPYAKEVAERVKTDHYAQQINVDLIDTFKKVSEYFDEPFADSSNIPMHLISEFARSKVKVVLSGDGGDELFWGYGQYRKHLNLPFFERMRVKFLSNPFDHYLSYNEHFNQAERKALLGQATSLKQEIYTHIDFSEAITSLEKINLVDMYMALPGDMLTKVDRSAMMNSLEVRSPFLNHTLAEYAYNLPPEFKAVRARGKVILGEIYKDVLPEKVFTRKKQGFNAPTKDWLMKLEFKSFVEESFKDAHIYKFMNKSEVEKVIHNFYTKDPKKFQYKLWILLCLEWWFKTHAKYHA